MGHTVNTMAKAIIKSHKNAPASQNLKGVREELPVFEALLTTVRDLATTKFSCLVDDCLYSKRIQRVSQIGFLRDVTNLEYIHQARGTRKTRDLIKI